MNSINTRTKTLTKVLVTIIGFTLGFLSLAVLTQTELVAQEAGDPCTTQIDCCCNQDGCSGSQVRCGNQVVSGTIQDDGVTCEPNSSACNWDNFSCQLPPQGRCIPPCEDCACEGPTGLGWSDNAPRPGAEISIGTRLEWTTPSSWGISGGREGSGCAGCTEASTGYYKVFVNGIDETARCVEAPDASNSSLSTPYCTIESVAPNWPNTAVEFRIESYNTGCGGEDISRTFGFPPNERPTCESVTVESDDFYTFRYSTLNIEDDQPFTVTYETEDPDSYGVPSQLDICFAAGNQPANFYQQGPLAFTCLSQLDVISMPKPSALNIDGDRITFTTTTDILKSYYSPSVGYSGDLDDIGFVFAINIFDNVDTDSFCSNNPGHNNGNGVYQDGSTVNGTCDATACRLKIQQSPPDILSVKNSGNYIGITGSSDAQCVSNNPHDFEAIILDNNGSADIDLVEISLADTDLMPAGLNLNGTSANWPLRIAYAKSWKNYPQAFSNGSRGIFMVRDTNATSAIPGQASSRRCINDSGELSSYDPTGWQPSDPGISRQARFNDAYSMFCFGSGQHQWEDASAITNLSPSDSANPYGVAVDIYFLDSDISVINENYPATLIGAPNWQDASYIAFSREDNRAFVRFRVEFSHEDESFLGDSLDNQWGGKYHKLWFASDHANRWDENANIPGEVLRTDEWDQVFHDVGKVEIDFEPPTINLEEPTVKTADTIGLVWTAEDSNGSIRRVYGEASHSDLPNSSPIRDDRARSAGDPDISIDYDFNLHSLEGAPYLWNRIPPSPTSSYQQEELINLQQNEEGSITFSATAVDNACNTATDNEIQNLYLPWFTTRGGHVYSRGFINNDLKTFSSDTGSFLNPNLTLYPYDIKRGEALTGTELISTGADINSSAAGAAAVRTAMSSYSLTGYFDSNLENPVFTDLLDAHRTIKAQNPDLYETVELSATTLNGNISALCPNDNKICIINAQELQIASQLTCDRRTLIYSSGSITIDADIIKGNNDNGCIIMSARDISIEDSTFKTGASNQASYDNIDAFLISNRRILIPEVDQGNIARDGLKVHGGMIALGRTGDNSLQFERSLKLLDNQKSPTQVVSADPRYLYLASQIFGSTEDLYKKEVGFK